MRRAKIGKNRHLVLSGALLLAAACGKTETPAEAAKAPAAEPAEPAANADPAAAPDEAAAAEAAPAAAAAAEAAAAPALPAPPAHDARHVRRVFDAYEKVRDALAQDDFEAAKRLAIDVGAIASEGKVAIFREMADAARKVTEQHEISGSRAAFRTLSARLRGVVHDTPVVAGQTKAFHCKAGAGAGMWIQLDPTPRNPYQGPDVPACADPTEL